MTIVKSFTGDGSTVTFDLVTAPASENDVLVAIDGVVQSISAYDVAGASLTFTAAPASGATIEARLGFDIIEADAVGPAQLQNTSVVAGNYANADITVDADGRLTSDRGPLGGPVPKLESGHGDRVIAVCV